MKNRFKNKIWYFLPMIFVLIYARPVDAIMGDCRDFCAVLFILVPFLFPLGILILLYALFFCSYFLFKIITTENKSTWIGYLLRILLVSAIFSWLFYMFYLK